MSGGRDRRANSASCDVLVPILAAVVDALAGLPCPQNRMLGRLSGLTDAQIDVALARGIAVGRLRRDVRRRSRRLVVLDGAGKAVSATAYSRPGGGKLPAARCEMAKAAARAAGGNPVDDDAASVTARPSHDDAPRTNNLRCPLCNLPPDHAECRHGWNGATMRTERWAIAMEAAA